MALIDSLVAYWALDEASGNRADSHSGGYTLTDNNTVGSNTGHVHATAGDFDKTSSETLSTTANDVRNALVSGTSWTVAAWIRPDDVGTFLPEALGTFHFAGIMCRRLLPAVFGSSEIDWNLWNDAGTFHNARPALNTPAGSWYFIAAKLDNADGKFYARTNATTTAGVAFSGTITASGGFRIGNRWNVGGGEYWDGRIGPVAVWSRALSGAELDELYNSGAGLAYPFSSAAKGLPVLLHHWQQAH